MLDFIERLRTKPEHVRKQFAVVAASALTALVAVGWAGALVTNASFALKSQNEGASLAEATGTFGESMAEARSGFSGLLGAAGVAGTGQSNEPALTIVDTKTSSTLDTQMSAPEDTRTVIPF
ncbi:MAG TPA: hypothetical protein VNU47_00790 [Candidatus Paceibacterota bacterium]|nr:hypothetical protein [Candidatus Paceibacterota bacterium]